VLLQPPEPEADALLAEARSTTRRVGRTFALACRLLPADVRDDVYRLYLVFRTLDDLVDEHAAGAPAAVAAVEAWCEDGSVGSREAAVLADLATRHELPRHALRDFCHGMRDDLEGRPVRTEADVDRYCYRVAGTVGVVMAAVLGTTRPGADRQAAALGMAMQRTNILRDLDEDRALGRCYVAQETLVRLGGDLRPGGREALVRDQIARADALYDEGVAGIGALRRGRFAIAAAAAMYREILRQIEREGYGARAGRAVVSAPRKLLVAARARPRAA
jgi:phytoene synthase